MRWLRIAGRLALLLGHIVLGLIISFTILRGVEGGAPEPRQQAVITWWMRRVGRIFGLAIEVQGARAPPPVLVVANHVSWLDIVVLASVLPVGFLSKAEIRRWPIVGVLAGRSGSLFIDRGGKNAADQAVEQISFRLRRGQSVAAFPEATISEGRSVRRFHPRLFAAAVHTEARVQPVAIRYPHPRGVNPVAPFLQETIVRHGLRVLGERQVPVQVSLCEELAASGGERRALANQAHTRVKACVEQSRAPGHALDEQA